MQHFLVNQATFADRKSLAVTLSEAFIDDPGLSWMVPDEEDRKRTFPRFFRAILTGSMRNGLVLQAHDCQAVTLWRMPNRTNPGFMETLLGLPQMLPLLRRSGSRARVMGDAVKSHCPGFPFRYLQFAGVSPGQQGKGLGGAVIRAGLELAASAGDPVYLETPKPANVALYLSMGFEVISEWGIEGTPLHFSSMLKRP